MKMPAKRLIETYQERPIRSELDLSDFISALDEDEGIRIEGNLRIISVVVSFS